MREPMRRKDRDITDWEEILRGVDSCHICRVGLCAGNVPYIVPLNFGWYVEEGKLRLVFHSAHEGRKLRMMEENPHVCFEMEPHVEMTGGGQRVRNYTTYFDCIMGEGTLRRVNESPEKERLLRILVEHHGLTGEWEVTQSHLDRCTALLLEVDWVSMKRKVPAPGLPVK